MSSDFHLNEDMYSFAQASKRLEDFESFLSKKGIRIERGSELERLGLTVFDVLYKHIVPSTQDTHSDVRPWLRDVLGMNDLIHKILRVQDHPSVCRVVAHLRLLNQGCPLQNVPVPVTDQASNKLFELLICCALMVHTSDVELDDPSLKKGNNPDVIGTLCGRRWGFACKVAHSLKGKTIFDSIAKGVEQIERSPVEIGVVIVNLKNVLHHDLYWTILNEDEWKNGAEPLFSGYSDYNMAKSQLDYEVCSIANLVLKAASVTDFRDLFRGKKALPALLFFASTAVGSEVAGKPVPTLLGFLKMFEIDSIGEAKQEALKYLNDGLQYNPRLAR